MSIIKTIAIGGVLTGSIIATGSANQKGGIEGQEAPEIKVDKWMNLPKGQAVPDKASLKGKVVYMYCYQSWCPGCHSSGFPTLKKVSDTFKNSKDVKFVVVQTVFEGFGVNSPDKWKNIAEKYKLAHFNRLIELISSYLSFSV